jgi:hypothetical protein
MKLSCLKIALVAGLAGTAYANDVVGRTFLSITPPYQTGSPEYISCWNKFTQLRCDHRFCLEVTPFGGRSLNPSGIAQYFLPFGNTGLIVAGDNAYGSPSNAGDRTVNAEHLNILYGNDANENTFKSTVSFCPRHTFYGVGIHGKLFFGECDGRSWWLDASMPIMHVNNDMQLREKVEQTGTLRPGTTIANATQAFAQSDWTYGKICGSKGKTGVADIEAKVGYEMIRNNCCDICFAAMDAYIGAVVPVGNKVKSTFVFEPMIGNNHHYGIIGGLFGSLSVVGCARQSMDVVYHADVRYLFGNKQPRSFDIVDKSWSRYMQVYASPEASAITPGINSFTQCMYVAPGFAASGAVIARARINQGIFELGYHCRVAQAESVSMKDAWPERVALAGVAGNQTTSLARTIRYNYLGWPVNTGGDADTPEYAAVPYTSIDLSSAALPASVAQTIFGSAGYVWKCSCLEGFLSLGGSLRYASDNSALRLWMVWCKAEISY